MDDGISHPLKSEILIGPYFFTVQRRAIGFPIHTSIMTDFISHKS